MQLSKLEIKGFKSFADKIVINFDKGITGIVGPNGCGKSNIVDAIRWVLGEQKISTLRSEKMENIIFNGTHKRQPLQLAEVSLTINNTKNIIATEYSQITITRRLYRSGESEYFLNNVGCRLKDISNLFLDTGITSNNYAIIELAMVDNLLNDRDNARKALFEEAAGISKFKKRKKETLRKIEATDSDLERVEDLLFEIEKNMKSLEKQAKQSTTYYQIKETYQQKSIQLAKVVVKKQREQFDALNQQLKSKNDYKIQLIAKITTNEASFEKYKNTLEEKEAELSVQQKAFNQYANIVQQHESDKKIKNERLRSLHDQIDRLKDFIEQDKKNNEKVKSNTHNLELEKKSTQNSLNELLKKSEVVKAEYQKQKEVTHTLQEGVETMQKTYYKQQSESYQVNKELEICKIQISSLTQETHRINTDVDHQHASVTNFESKLHILQDEISKKNTQIEALKKKEENAKQNLTVLEKDIDITREQVIVTGRKLDACKNEHKLTLSLVENMEGFPEAIKFLKKNTKWSNSAPLLSDILSTSDIYRVAIENYLEPYLNYYIVESKEDALQAINTLSDAGKGKANFFILNAFKNFNPSHAKKYSDAFPAIQIVEYNKKYEKLMSYMLDKVYIHTGNIDSIISEDENSFITQNGSITRKQFTLSGGSIGLFEGKKIGRKKNLEKLAKEIQSLTQYIEKAKKDLLNQQQQSEKLHKDNFRQQIEEAQNEVKMISDEFISLKTKKEQFLHMLNTASLRKEDIQEKIKSLEKEMQQISLQATNALDRLTGQEQKLNQSKSNLRTENDILTQRSASSNEQYIILHQEENKFKSIEQEIKFKKESIEQSNLRVEKSIEDLKKHEDEIKKIITSTQDTSQTLVSMYTKKEEMENLLNKTEKKYYATKEESNQLDSTLHDMQHERQHIDNFIIKLKDELSESKLSLNSVKERLSVEFKVQLDEIIEQTDPQQEEIIPSEDILRSQIDKIKDRMGKMEPINPIAMEAYDEIKERNDFITTQKEDLIKAKTSLLETISKIEEVANQAFMEAFQKIKEHFVNIFRSLFHEGDQCDLKLTDPANLLESKIDIIAKPKGKRPLTINQLSGGEKTLTAVALLFSIYLFKPAPFCIFDEVDAPLDDANIDKFNMITRNFSKESQFIIVTHNKRTMTQTDVIYGITMIEKGVSKAVPVNLRELA